MKLSILMPVYNEEDRLGEALKQAALWILGRERMRHRSTVDA